jgi:hypothetical protein
VCAIDQLEDSDTFEVVAMQISEKNDDVSERLKNINDHFSYNLYENVCRSLFEKDKLLFSALLSLRILMSQCLLSEDSVAFLLTGGVGIAEAKVDPPENRCDFVPFFSSAATGHLREGFGGTFNDESQGATLILWPSLWHGAKHTVAPNAVTHKQAGTG